MRYVRSGGLDCFLNNGGVVIAAPVAVGFGLVAEWTQAVKDVGQAYSVGD
jgi:hypothetical protein